LKIVSKIENQDIATVYIAEMPKGRMVEFVESLQPPIPREKKWVFIISTLYGCPIGCPMCDAGTNYQGKLSKEEMFDQIDFMIKNRYSDGKVEVDKFKIQFARLGEPSLNDNVLQLLRELPERIDCRGLMPSFSTIAPRGRDAFFNDLIEIKNNLYGEGNFQFQFSIHSTNCERKEKMIPASTLGFQEMSDFGRRYFKQGDRKISLNFALSAKEDLSAEVIHKYFDKERFLIKITPINPTINARRNKLGSIIKSKQQALQLKSVRDLINYGYDVIISIGELEENKIGSNCGQYIKHFLDSKSRLENSYSYEVKEVSAD
jgi:23S rRNA (adenine2503-C2)-methyltransferase